MAYQMEQRTLSCKLTPEELDTAKTDLSTVCREEEDVSEEKKAVQKSFATRLEEIRLRRITLVGKIQSGTEYRAVECEWKPDYLKGNKTLFRTDTREAIQTVLLTERERQTELDVTSEGDNPPEDETLADKPTEARAHNQRKKGH